MQRHPNGTRIPTRHAPDTARSMPRPLQTFLLGLGLAATCAVALLALTAMTNPTLTGQPTPLPATEHVAGRA